MRFEDLEKCRMLEALHEALRALGLNNPFHREHQGRAGALTHIDGRECINFSSYDDLGLKGDPRLTGATHAAIDEYRISPSASRLVAGERDIHGRFEVALARHYGTAAALAFVSGHATNVTTIGELTEPGDLILHDSLIHNSVMVGAQLSGAMRRSFPQNDARALDEILDRERARFRNVLIVVEGLYSIDGDTAALAEVIDVKRKHGCWLMVDDAHGLGALGATGRGAFDHAGIDPSEVDIWMGTLSKTLSSTGGYVIAETERGAIVASRASSGLPLIWAQKMHEGMIWPGIPGRILFWSSWTVASRHSAMVIAPL